MPENVTPASLTVAQDELSNFVFRHAEQLSTRLGFSWTAAPDAPNTYKDLVAAFNQSQQTNQPLPVSDENSSRTVFGTPEANFAYRFVHDVHHVEGGLRFSSKDEFRLAVEIVALFEAAGGEPCSLPWLLLHADAVGQALFYAVAESYVTDQLQFALDCVRFGLEGGIERELRRQS